MRIGFGYDSHRFTTGGFIVIGGVKIPFEKGVDAHSDGDVLLHAVCDALLGAAALGDLGMHFPDTSDEFKNIESASLIKKTMRLVTEKNYSVNNIDSTIILEKPKLAEHIPNMQKNLSSMLNIPVQSISVKATTNEGMGFVGRGEGLAAYVVVSLNQE